MSTRNFSRNNKFSRAEPPSAPAPSPKNKKAVSQLREEIASNSFSLQVVSLRAGTAPKETCESAVQRFDPYAHGGLNE
jgi:hypothetical protein